MSHILVPHKVDDYKKWNPVFDEHSGFRSQNGSKGGTCISECKRSQ